MAIASRQGIGYRRVSSSEQELDDLDEQRLTGIGGIWYVHLRERLHRPLRRPLPLFRGHILQTPHQRVRSAGLFCVELLERIFGSGTGNRTPI